MPSLSADCNFHSCGVRDHREERQLLPWPSQRGLDLVGEFYLDALVPSDQHYLLLFLFMSV